MTMVWKKIKRSGHQASKFNFNVAFTELVIESNGNKRPEKVLVACMKSRRRYACEARPLEKSFSNEARSLLVWPGLPEDSIDIETTLFKDPNKDNFENKEWTLVVEEITSKGKQRALAAISLNFCFFVNENPDIKTELKLKLRSLQKSIANCTLSLVLSSLLLKKGKATDEDVQSNISFPSGSKIPIDFRKGELEDDDFHVAQGVAQITEEFDKWKEEKTAEIVKPVPVPVARNAWGPDDEVPAQVAPPLPPHRPRTISRDSQPEPGPSRRSTDSGPPRSVDTGPITGKRRDSSNSVLRNLPLPPPTPIKDEPLIKWCQRVTSGYRGVKITDLSKSWRSGLAFCAILHRYDPSLIGNFDDLDFSDTKTGQKENCKKAFEGALTIGVEKNMDEGEITIYSDEKKITDYLRRLRMTLQGPEWDEEYNPRKSEYRISKICGLSEAEMNVVEDLERMRKLRGEDEADKAFHDEKSFKNNEGKITSKVKVGQVVESPKERKMIEIEEEEEKRIPARKRRDSVKELEEHEKLLKKMAEEMKSLANEVGSNSPTHRFNPTLTSTPNSNQNPNSGPSPPPPAPREDWNQDPNDFETSDNDQMKKRYEEARMILDGIYNRGTPVNPVRPSRGGRPQYNYYSVRSAQASPSAERRSYTHSRHGSDLSNTIQPSTSDNGYHNPHDAPPGAQPSAFDRVKRYGSMRGAELAETLAQFVSPIMEPPRPPRRTSQDPPRRTSQDPPSSYSQSVNATPTRKIVTNFERNVVQVENINEELQKIVQRLDEVEKLDRYVEEKIRNVEPGTEDEQKFIAEHMKLLTEKDALVRRQDYLNVAAALSEVEEKLVILQQKVNEVTQNNDDYKTEEEKQRIDALVHEYKSLIDKKNELAMELEPLNTSKRIMNWIRSTTS
ncbi:hypothetical protein FO519_008730 [Halicephalobus sp. NKZ332]|nr:hypothetical protein FO519_008730 [Halicephalobus sp. NKZ332]